MKKKRRKLNKMTNKKENKKKEEWTRKRQGYKRWGRN